MRACIAGPADPIASTLLAQVTAAPPEEADVLLNLDSAANPEVTIAGTEDFAARCRPGAAILMLVAGGAGWPASRRLATIAAFARHAALAWAPRRLRTNVIALCAPGPAGWNAAWPDAGVIPAAPATAADVARVAQFLLLTPSITGQLVRLAT